MHRKMGNSESSSTNPRFALAKRSFTEKYLEDLKSLFNSLAAQSQPNANFISPSVFKAYIGIEGPLGDRIFDLVTQKRKDGKLTFEDLVIAKATYEKGTNNDIEEFIYQLLDVFGDGIVGRSDLEAVLTAVLGNISSHESYQSEPGSEREILDIFLNAANLTTDGKEGADSSISFEEFRNWCARLPSILHQTTTYPVLSQVRFGEGEMYVDHIPARVERLFPVDSRLVKNIFEDMFGKTTLVKKKKMKIHPSFFITKQFQILHHEGANMQRISRPQIPLLCMETKKFTRAFTSWPACSQIPMLIYPDNIDPSILLLRKEYAWHVGGALQHEELHEWKLLYHSTVHGLSFNTFLGNISNDKGPTLLIIKDKEGYIYGGYASQPWERHADFYGDMKSFLFQLYPKASVFRPTGANSNIQWCAINFSSESIPNGIGFGGRVNHFGLFISANFDQGRTFTCTTFGSPSLSKTQKVIPEVIECWGVAIKRAQEDDQDKVRGTVLERFKEDRHMLNMVGLANSSE